ncbi:MAG: beta-lactamase family protein [Bacteroidales bacterium]|nr:beta-lactamase family protein [Bacteroidales bacterium]
MWLKCFRFLILAFLSACIACCSHKPEKPAQTAKPAARRVVQITNASNDTVLLPIDRAIKRFLRDQWLAGGISVAVAYKGRLVYAKGFGYADTTSRVAMQPFHTMRIASVSKLITAVAVMKLVEEGRIGLRQNVFGPDGILNDSIYLTFKDPRMGNVTVYQLLNHSGGWTPRYGDPMFMPHAIARQTGKPLPVSMKDIICFMQTKSLHFEPGTGSNYSNFGYGILGEVVAKAAGMPYEQYVQKYILSPFGINDMYLGHSHQQHRFPTETAYYEADTTQVADYTNANIAATRAYGGNDIHTLGSAGGWIASSVDLVKIALATDGFDNVPDCLTAASIDTMVQHEEPFDPIGWRTTASDGSWFRTGTLSATTAMLARLPDSICYAVISNSANHRGTALAAMLRNIMNDAVHRVAQWPDTDLLRDDSQWQEYKGKLGKE